MGLVGVIGAAHEGTGFDVGEAEGGSGGAVFGELLGWDVAQDGEVFGRGAEVLAEGEDVDLGGAEVAHDGLHFVHGLAEAEHEAGFGGDVGAEALGISQHVEGTFVGGAEADLAVEAGDGFGVVIEDVGAGVHEEFHGFARALKVGHEDFDAAGGEALADGADGHGEQEGAAVLAVIAVDAGDDGVFQSHGLDGFGDAAGLVHVDFERGAFLNGAEAAAARADVAEDHEGGGAAVPAIADVGAGGGFADGVEAEAGDEALETAVVVADGGGGAEPFWALGAGPVRTLGA